MNINPDTLHAQGYRSFPHHEGKGCTHGFQKTIFGPDHEKLYFINVYLWDMSCFSGRDDHKSVSVEICLFQPGTISDKEYTNVRLTVPVWNPETNIGQIEELVSGLYDKLGCIPDFHNN